jgi:16S rRNA (uracil1498-N3)-methyltransferase
MKVRIYVKESLFEGGLISIPANNINYLRNVLRSTIGDILYVFNENDGEWEANIAELGKKSGGLSVLKQTTKPQKNPLDVWLVFAPIKSGRIDFLAQKATELGVSALAPTQTQHTIVTRVNTERLQANATEAAEQCERLSVPEVFDHTSLEKTLNAWDEGRTLLFCDESGQGAPILEALQHAKAQKEQQSWGILIGPEGGFSQAELKLIHSKKFTLPVSLGPRILRADTAALAALTCWQTVFGDWDQSPHFEPQS